MLNTVTISHMCLLSTGNVVSETEELNFYLYFNEFNFKEPSVARGHHTVQEGSKI